MKLIVFLLLYFTGVMPAALFRLQTVPHYYYFVDTRVTWQVAQNYCRVSYTDLATVESAEDWVKLKKEATSKKVISYVWLGLYNDIKGWYWTLNNTPLGFLNWYSGEPNNDGTERCGAIESSGSWGNFPCTSSYHFVCYNASSSGAARYVVVPQVLGWYKAQVHCKQFYTDLASATTATENNQIKQKLASGGRYWFGLIKNNWKWSDGKNISSLTWYSGTPDNLYGNEECTILYEGGLGDISCANQYPFFCHTIPPVREKQILKLRLKADARVLDPAVQSDILEQIRKKLSAHNMLQNTTVYWRVQPDGSIFQKKDPNNDHL